MCLIISSGPHIAKKDFYVVKIMEGVTKEKAVSPYRSFQYTFNTPLISKIKIERRKINVGIHAIIVDGLAGSSWVLRSVFCHFDWPDLGSGYILCKIPKGATYYLGDDNDIVTDNLIPLEPIGTIRDDGTIEDGEVINLTFRGLAVKVEEYVKTMQYNIIPS